MFKFRMSTLLWAMIPISMICLWWSIFLDSSPLVWKQYSPQQVQNQIDADKIVLLRLHADWDLMSGIHDNRLEKSRVLKRRLRNTSIKLFESDFTRRNKLANFAHHKYDVRGRSCLIILHKSLPEPIVIDDVFQEDELTEILDRIQSNKRSK